MSLVQCGLTLLRSQGARESASGSFSGASAREFAVVRGSDLELLRVDDQGKLHSVCRTTVFAVIRGLQVIRQATRDRLVLSSDSGHLSIVEFDAQSVSWRICSVSGNFGRSGCRRDVPGQYLSMDISQRGVLVASVENEKLLFLLNADGSFADQPPIELPRPSEHDHVIFSICAVATNEGALAFAAVEGTKESRTLTVYEVELQARNINTYSAAVSNTANIVVPLPHAKNHILVCGQGQGALSCFSVKLGSKAASSLSPACSADLPADSAVPGAGAALIVAASSLAPGDGGGAAVAVVQTECGSLYTVRPSSQKCDGLTVTLLKLSVCSSSSSSAAEGLSPSNSLALSRAGAVGASAPVLLFCASEISSHALLELPSSGSVPRVLDLLPNSGPVTDALADDFLGLSSPQIAQLCGRGSSSCLRLLTPGCSVVEFASSMLPAAWGRPTGIFPLKKRDEAGKKDGIDDYILIAYPTKTFALRVQGDLVVACKPEEVQFDLSVKTIGAIVLEDQATLQIHARGLRHISAAGNVSDWAPPDSKPVERCSYNLRQVLVVLSGGDLIYFEVDTTGEVPILELGTLELGKDVTCVELGEVPEGQHRAPFAAVGCWDNTLQIISVQPQDILNQRAASSFVAEPRSLCIISTAASGGATTNASLSLYVGLANGELIKMTMHPATGALTVARQSVVATKAPTSVSLARVAVSVPGSDQPVSAVLVMSSRTLLIYSLPQHQPSSSSSSSSSGAKEKECAVPLRLLDCVATISTRAHRSGLAGISAGRFFFFDLTNFAQTFGETKHALKYTPRRMSRLPGSSSVAVVEADQSVPLQGEVRKRTGASMDVDEPECASSLPSKPFAPLPRSTPGRWVSCLRVLNLANGVSEAVVELTENTAAFSVAALNFSDKGHVVAKLGEEGGYASMTYIVIGTAKGLSSPTSSSGSGYALETYCSRGGKLSHLHSTEIEDVPLCMVEFQEKLLVGIGRSLRLYDLGRKRLLRKCELRGFPNHITKLAVSGGRVFVGDVTDSVTFVKYDKLDNTLKVFAEEQRPRFISALCALDEDTAGGGDRFGNVFLLRLPDSVDDDVGRLGGHDGAVQMAEQFRSEGEKDRIHADNYLLSHFYLGEAVTSVTPCQLSPSASNLMLASTVGGAIVAFVPFPKNEESAFFLALEAAIRLCQDECGMRVRAVDGEKPAPGSDLSPATLAFRNHLSFRSYFQPVKNTVDGDLCEHLLTLPQAMQIKVAQAVGRPLGELRRRILDARAAALGAK